MSANRASTNQDRPIVWRNWLAVFSLLFVVLNVLAF
jgi:hypothetical protein